MTVHGDFSRQTTDATRWAGVLHQQGRVLMDADGNAQTAIMTNWQDTAARDTIGAGIAAVPASAAASFRIDTASVQAGKVVLEVQPGHAWVDGLLVYLDGKDPQKIIAVPMQRPLDNLEVTTDSGSRTAVVLETWREAVHAFQVPEVLIEPALGGVDTTERLSTAKAFRLYPMKDGESCESIRDLLADDFSVLGRLTITLEPDITIPGDCPVVEAGGYSGFLHSLGRIEIAKSDSPLPRFKWSLFNGGLVGRASFDAATNRATILANLTAITSVDLSTFYLEAVKFDAATGLWDVVYGAEVTLDEGGFILPLVPEMGTIPGGDPVFIRLWHGIGNVADFPAGPTPATLIDGIQLGFDPMSPTAQYRSGDYWTFTVRAGDIPQTGTLPTNAPPEGIHYHRVPLAVLEWDATGNLSHDTGTIEDCRQVFHPLTRMGGCCTFSVGDGVHSHGDFESIQSAIQHLPPEGGQVCILPGTYVENVLIDKRRNITISGCDERCLVVSPEARANPAPVFHVINSPSVEIRGLAIQAHPAGIGILLEDTVFEERGTGKDVGPSGALAHQHVHDLVIRAAQRPAIEVHGGIDVTIHDCLVEMFDVPSGWPAIFFQGEDGLIERNVIRIRPESREAEPRAAGRGLEELDRLLRQRREVLSPGEPLSAGAHLGGIQIGGLSERVRVIDNLIQGGIGNGITLGSVRVVNVDGQDTGIRLGWVINLRDPCNPCKPGGVIVVDPGPDDPDGQVVYVPAGPLREIDIERNRILDMGLNGIGVVGYFAENPEVLRRRIVTIEGLRIDDNDILRCLWRSLAEIPEESIDSVGYGGISLASVQHVRIRGNTIEDNGPDYLEPVCGIFILAGIELNIHNNRIVNNGAPTQAPQFRARAGRRGGINIVIAAAPDTEDLKLGGFSFQGRAALRLHENVVSVPLGQALAINAYGPVSVQGNSFSSKGLVLPSRQGGNPIYGATVAINCLTAGPDEEPYADTTAGAIWQRLLAQFEQRAVVTRESPSGSVLFSDNQCQFMPFPPPPVVVELEPANPGALNPAGISGAITRIANPVFARLSPAARTNISALLSRRIVANPAVRAIAQPLPLPIASVSVLSLDDIALTDNQFVTSLPEGSIVTQVFALGYAARVLGNRFREGANDTTLSAVTLAGMNITAHNTASHCLMVYPADSPPGTGHGVDGPNMYPNPYDSMNCPSFGRLRARFSGQPIPDDIVIDPVLGHIESSILDTLADARFMKISGSAALLDLQQAHLDSLVGELTIRHEANPESARLVDLQRRVDRESLIVRNLDLQMMRVSSPVPEGEAQTWILSGRVIASDGGIPAGARLQLLDSRDQPLPGAEAARIDRSGDFTARIPVAEEQEGEASAVTVLVTSEDATELARHETDFIPAAGKVDYIEIELGEDIRRTRTGPG